MYTEIKYLNLLSIRLEKFKQKKDYLWNFRCPVCGDSQRFKNKARGFVFQIKGKLVYKCHNCSVGMSLPNLIETIDPILYKEYRLEKFKETNPHQKVDMRKVKKIVSQKPTFKKDILSDITPLNKLNIAQHWLILHGRYLCKARNPECGRCGITSICKYYSRK